MTPAVEDVLQLVHRLYREDDWCTQNSGIVGGHLHIVLDDGNTEEHHVRWCLKEARKDQCWTCIKIAELMLELDEESRGELSDRAYDR